MRLLRSRVSKLRRHSRFKWRTFAPLVGCLPDVHTCLMPSGPSFRLETPAGDDRERRVCTTCGFVDYINPRIVVGSVVVEGELDAERILLCRRAIDPRKGYWTLPAGFMETGGNGGSRGLPRSPGGGRVRTRRGGPLCDLRSDPRGASAADVSDAAAGISLFSRNREPGSRSIQVGGHPMDRTGVPLSGLGVESMASRA